MGMKLANNAVSRLASGIAAGATSISVTPGDGAKFPALSVGDYFPATLIRASDGAVEIIRVTARSTDVLTVARGQESTTALAFVSGDRIELRLTAGAAASLTEMAIADASNKATLVDADELPLADSAASFGLKKVSFASLKATLKTYFLGLAGGTLTGFLTLHADPSSAMHAATKQYVDKSGVSLKNRIINGKMDIAQRGSSFAAITTGDYSADRWGFGNTSAAVLTASQQADGPGYDFPSSLRLAVTTADTAIAAGDQSTVGQVIEGCNVRDLVGRSFTLSFWVRSSKTGTHCVSFRNSTPDRSYVAEYTINVANTWEFKTVTITGGLPTAGTWNWANGAGLRVSWALAAGSTYQTAAGAWQTGNFLATANQVNALDTVGNIFAITGVQLEIGATATPFGYRAYGLELSLCERYFEAVLNADRCSTGAGAYSYAWRFRQQKRAAPTVIASGLNQSGLSVDGVTLWATTIGGLPPTPTNASAEIAYV